VKRTTYTAYKSKLENDLKMLEDNVDAQIAFLKNEAKLNYDGAVEISTTITNNLYQDFKNICGLIWCLGNTTEDDLPMGMDEATL